METHIIETWNNPYGKPLFISAAAILVILALWKIPQWQVQAYHGKLDSTAISRLDPKDLIQLQKDLITAENNARLALAQIIGGLVVLLGLYATFKNVQVAQKNAETAQDNLRVVEEGKLTERFSKAVELLGSDKLDMRLGGIYALERIARDSAKDHWTVMEVLTAFVRDQIQKKWELAFNLLDEPDDQSEQEYFSLVRQTPPEDVQAVLTVIGRRKWTHQEKLEENLNLRRTFLANVNISNANLDRADLSQAILDYSIFRDVKLNSSKLVSTSFNFAKLKKTVFSRSALIGAKFYKTTLSDIEFIEADLRRAFFSTAITNNVNFQKADLELSNLKFAKLTNANFTEANLSKADLRGSAGIHKRELPKAANFSDIDLKEASFHNAKIEDLKIKGADLSQVRGLTWEKLQSADFDETTKIPPALEERRKQDQASNADNLAPAEPESLERNS